MEFEEIVEVERTADVRCSGDFASLMLAKSSVDALIRTGYKTPSPVQKSAIPIGLLGFDMLVQAKSGTGKTLVFVLMALERVKPQLKSPQVIILAPTREIAAQISAVLRRLAPPIFNIGLFVGGENTKDDLVALRKGIHIAVGTTGRLSQLVSIKKLSVANVRLFILDEADKLMDECFREHINFLFSSLPDEKQVAVFSATYPRGLDSTLAQYMRAVRLVRLNPSDVQLLGIKQYAVIRYSGGENDTLIKLLSSITFNQCLVFTSCHTKCEEISKVLQDADINADLISGSIQQSDRTKVMKRLKNFDVKVLVSTDLTARGIDAQNVSAVVNMGPPPNCETYLHRIGRAGRFGGYGAAFTILSRGKEVGRFVEMAKNNDLHVKLLDLSKKYPIDLCSNESFHSSCKDFKPVERKKFDCADRDEEIVDGCDDIAGLSSQTCESDEKESEERILDMSNMKEESGNDALHVLQWTNISVKEEKAYKFVPLRTKNRRKFYLRGELLAVRESLSVFEWYSYFKKRFGELLKEEIFFSPMKENERLPLAEVPSNVEIRESSPVNAKKESDIPAGPSIERGDTSENAYSSPCASCMTSKFNDKYTGTYMKDASSSDAAMETRKNPLEINDGEKDDNRKRYSRKELMSIRKSKPRSVWEKYTRERFRVDDEPFQMDPALRVPVAQQIRVLRDREKQARIAVLAERQKREEKEAKPEHLVFATSRYESRVEIPETLEEFAREFKQEMEKSLENCSESRRVGPVVSVRRNPKEYFLVISEISAEVENSKTNFIARLRQRLGQSKQQEVSTSAQGIANSEKEVQVDMEELTSQHTASDDVFLVTEENLGSSESNKGYSTEDSTDEDVDSGNADEGLDEEHEEYDEAFKEVVDFSGSTTFLSKIERNVLWQAWMNAYLRTANSYLPRA